MNQSSGKGRGLQLAFVVGLGIAGLAARPAAAQMTCEGIDGDPYVFILLDTSGSMNWAPPCSQAELAAGLCTARCDTSDCWVPLQADDPGSKFFQAKQALHEVLSSTTGVQLGFATYNQDDLHVQSKHWIYEAASAGITLPGWGAFPAVGAREVFGRLWSCDTGSGDNEIGCYATTPADLNDGWELERVQQLAKGGQPFNQTVTFYVRYASTYKVSYTPAPVPPATLGSPITLIESVLKCMNSACTSTASLGQKSISFVPVAEKIGWDNGVSRTNPSLGYFPSSSDSVAGNSCGGWEPNTDTSVDPHSGYNLRWPTVSGDPRGSAFNVGDMIPLDWLTSHRDDILARLAPNLTTDPTAAPDFRTSPYFQDQPISGTSYLRLKNQNVRPLVAVGSTPMGASLDAFRQWWSVWRMVAQTQDFEFACRPVALIVLTDGDETCNVNACTSATLLYQQYGIKVYTVGFGVPSAYGTQLACMAANGGTSAPYTPHLRQELVDTLTGILDDIKAGN